MATVGEGTEDALNLLAEGGTENGAWRDRVTNAEIWNRNNKKNMVLVAYSLKWKWGGHVAEGHKLHQCGTSEQAKVYLATEDLTGRHVQESSRRTMVTSSLPSQSYFNCKNDYLRSHNFITSVRQSLIPENSIDFFSSIILSGTAINYEPRP